MPLVILIGASAAGKTTIAKAIEARHGDEADVHYFDRIGVPSVEEMIAEYGSGEAWQRVKTNQSKGLRTGTLNRAKSRTLRVATVRSCTSAVAAIMASS
jgi:dephospho-CoA kinase